MTAARHPRRVRTPEITTAIDADRRAARTARDAGNLEEAWRLLERTHILSQPWPWPHVRSHFDMLRLAVHARDRREVVGQIVRTLVAGPGSASGRYPLGNTGRSKIPATQPMPVPVDLAESSAESASPPAVSAPDIDATVAVVDLAGIAAVTAAHSDTSRDEP